MKKIMTVLLALVMALALLPATIWAENSDPVAKTNDGTEYSTLVDAVKNVKDGGTVTLLKDFTGGGIGTYKTPGKDQIQAKNFTIDFGGYTYTMIDPTVGSTTFETQCFHFEWAGQGKTNYKVTLKNGALKVGDNVRDAKILIQNYCDLTLDGMKLDGTNLQGTKYVLSNNCGNVTIKDTVITAASDGVAMDVYGGFNSYSDVTVTVTGKSVINGKIEVDRSSSTNYNKNTLKIESGTFNGPLSVVSAKNENTKVTVKGGSFTDLANAFKYAADKATVKLAADVNADTQIVVDPGKDITLDMNGKTLKYVGKYLNSGVIAVHNGGTLTVTGNGTIDCGNYEVDKSGAMAAITVTVRNDDPSKVAKLVVENGTFLGNEFGISGNGMRKNSDITVNGGVIEARHNPADDSEDSIAIYNPQEDGKLTINGGELKAVNAAVEIRSGELVINNGTFKATAPSARIRVNGNGGTAVGAAIAVAQHNTHHKINATINGGTFFGEYAFCEANPQGNSEEYIKLVTMSVTGGTFNGAVVSEDITGFITGGTFTTNPSRYIAVPADYDITIEADKTYTVTKKSETNEPAEVKVVGNVVGGEGDKTSKVEADVKPDDITEGNELTFTDGIKTGVTFNDKAVNEIKTAGGQNLTMVIETKPTAIKENKAAFDKAVEGKKADSALVVSLSLKTEEGMPVFTTEKEGATATVTIPYTLAKGEKLVVYYLDGDKLVELDENDVKYADGIVTLTLKHFSEYVLTTVPASGNPGEDPGNKPGEGPGDKPGEDPGNKPGEEPGNKPGEGSGNKPADGKGDTTPKTFDAGIAVYGVTAILSVTGMAWVGLKKRK